MKEGKGLRVWQQKKVWTPEEIFAHCIEEGECLVWFGKLNKGVPYISHEGKQISLRPYLYTEVYAKRLHPGCQVVPICGNPRCLAKDCLTARSRSKINQERADRMSLDPVYVAKKRAGARNLGIVKLDDEAAARIRADSRSAKELAEEHGVHLATIHRIRRGASWAPSKVVNSVWQLGSLV